MLPAAPEPIIEQPDPVAPGQASLFGDLEVGASQSITLTDRFGVPPFSVLDQRAGYWQQRKAEWLALGIESELGREMAASGSVMPGIELAKVGKGLVGGNKTEREYGEAWDTSKGQNAWAGSGTSIFDPVICELAYRWFTPQPGSAILDPFAGGSVRGIVASVLGHRYTGVDLSGLQLAANRAQAERIVPGQQPLWLEGDSRELDGLLPAGEQYDLIFSCPPYFDLEVYSDHPSDLSAAKTYGAFLEGYAEVIEASLARLRPGRFAVWVIGEVRDRKGMQRGLVSDTIGIFRDAGAHLYNEAVVISPIGTLHLRAPKAFNASRKLGRGHQAVLVFWRGDEAGPSWGSFERTEQEAESHAA